MSRKPMIVVGICVISLLILSGCSLFSSSTAGTSERIGPAGGSVEDPGGASVSIPPDALQEETEIGVTTFSSVEEMDPKFRSSFVGANGVADFQPDGIVFEEPVRITIPSEEPLNPGDEYRLFMWNEKDQAWQATEFIAMVDPDGMSYSADVTHFTTMTGSVKTLSEDYLKGFVLNDNYPIDIGVVWQAYKDWYNKILSYKRGVGLLGLHEDCCWEVKGVEFEIIYQKKEAMGFGDKQINNIDYNNKYLSGEKDDYDWQESVQGEFGPGDSHQGSPDYAFLKITVYWKATDPWVIFQRSPGLMNVTCEDPCEEEIVVKAVCGKYLMEGLAVNFLVDGVGSVNPESVIIGDDGYGRTTFTAEEKGKATISAEVISCQDEPEKLITSKKSQEICIKECDRYHFTGEIDFLHSGSDVSWEFFDRMTVTFEFEKVDNSDEFRVTDARGSHSVNIIAVDPECSIQNVSAPDFSLNAQLRVEGDQAIVSFVPKSLPLSFTWHCPSDVGSPLTYTVNAYSYLEQSVIGKHMTDLRIDYDGCTGFKEGYVSEGFDEYDMPIDMDYSLNFGCDGSCE